MSMMWFFTITLAAKFFGVDIGATGWLLIVPFAFEDIAICLILQELEQKKDRV